MIRMSDGSCIAGVVVAIFSASDRTAALLARISLEERLRQALGPSGFDLLGVIGFGLMGLALYLVARRRLPPV